MRRLNKPLTVFSLAMINIAAVSSVRNWPTIAEYGLTALFFLLLAIVIFLIPVALISAELATGWPQTGGVYAWVRAAFGHRIGFLAIWLLWAENLAYYPALISFIAGTVAYIISPGLAHNMTYILCSVVGLFWLTTLANLRGMRTSSWISSIGVIGGTILPALLIITLGALWCYSGNPLQVTCSWEAFFPKFNSIRELVLFSGIFVSFAGLEMSAVHAGSVVNPQRNYPRAILLSGLLILSLYIAGVLAIALVVPRDQISLVAGSFQAFSLLLAPYHLEWLLPLVGFLLALGAWGTLSTWIAGPSMGLLAAAQGGDLPPLFKKHNAHNMPAPLLIAQACAVTLFSSVFLFMPTVSSAYWILTATLAQIYLLMYILLFTAAIRLRYKHPLTPRAYRIPGGNWGIWLVGGTGLLGTLATFFVGFFPPEQIAVGSPLYYIGFLVLSIVLVATAPSLILLWKKPYWQTTEKGPSP